MRVLWRPLYHFALSKCKDPDTAQDLTSQVILALVENVGSGLEIRDHEAWCVTVLKNKFKDHVKKKEVFFRFYKSSIFLTLYYNYYTIIQ